ncbi:glycerol uptake facilitator-like aquaporin [Streptacidiphilus sp. MAP12-20]|uniref:hypothetical protein n=1 Tax=Streptacidiphilus sp. MAP12-20 TaxID=3156299 RepID=UPI003519CB7B
MPASIGAGIWFTPSGAFTNPAITVVRALTGGPTRLAPGSLPGFLAAQLLGTVVGVALAGWFFPASRQAIEPPGRAVEGVETVGRRVGAVDSSGMDGHEHLAKISVSYTG